MYGKLFAQMYDGTLVTAGWQALVTFQQLVILADKRGVVDMTVDAICRKTTIPVDIIGPGIDALLLPDPNSRTPDEDGRRIVLLGENRNWGWRIVNYKYYRNLRNEEERREYHRNYWHNRKDSTDSTDSTPTQQTQPSVRHAVSSKQNAVSSKQEEPGDVPQRTAELLAGIPRVPIETPATRIFDHWKRTHGHLKSKLDAKRIKLINAALKLYDEDTLRQSISGYLHSPHHMGTDPKGSGTKYDDIEIMLRDAKHVDAGLAFQRAQDQRLEQKKQSDIDAKEFDFG